MKTITKVALSTMTLVAVAAGSVAGTLAYLQSQTPVATNVMAAGGVEIKQLELQRADNVKHNAEATIGSLVPFEQNQIFAPAHPVEGASNPYTAEPTDLFEWGPYVTADGAANGLWNDDKLEGVIDKFVFVENTGDSACYYRTLIAFECPEDTEYSEGSDKEFMMNVNLNSRFKWSDEQYITVGGTRYLLMVATYTESLAAKEISRPSLLQVVMTHNATNEDVEKLNGEYEILVMSQACQTENFDSADAALDKVFGAADTTNATKWFSESLGIVTVSNTDELNAAIEAGAEDIVLNAGNYGVIDVTVNRTLNISAAAGADVKIAGIDGQSNNNSTNITIKGVTLDNSLQTEGWFTGTSPKIKPCVGVWGGNYTFEDCTFNVTGNSGAETGVMSWWTTNHGVMNFTNCTFNGENASARGMQIYGNYDLNVTGCTFNTAKDYSIKFVGDEGCVATFENNTVNATTNFVQTGSAPYAGANYSLVFVNNNLADGIKHVYVDNAEGQTIIIDGETKEATDEAIY